MSGSGKGQKQIAAGSVEKVKRLLQYCATDTERERLQLVIDCGSVNAAIRQSGVARATFQGTVYRIESRAALHGNAPAADMMANLAQGEVLKGRSFLTTSPSGNPVWYKTRMTDEARILAWKEMLQAFKDDLPKANAVTKQPVCINDLLNLFIITDLHLGMKAWHEETGSDWDLNIAEDLLIAWFDEAIASAPKAEVAVLAQLGDFVHFDGLDSVTPTSGHLLDADTRFQKIVRVAIRVIRHIIRALLNKFPRVHVLMAEGNHDMASSVWLREWVHAFYDDEPRVTVELSPDPYYCFEWGDTALFFHHGHKQKMERVDTVFTRKFRDVFGRTKHCYGHMGHYHSDKKLETNLMTIEQHRTMASPDAYASRGGYLSGRSASVITYDKRHGEIKRLTITPESVT